MATSPARLLLRIQAGPHAGQETVLSPGSWVVLARASSASDATVPLTRDGDRALDDERQQIVNRVVSRTGEGAPRVRARGHRTHDVELEDDGVSRTHAVVFLDVEGGASVADLMSTNGTTLNGQRVSDADLKDGDVLQVGDTRLLVGLAR